MQNGNVNNVKMKLFMIKRMQIKHVHCLLTFLQVCKFNSQVLSSKQFEFYIFDIPLFI